MATLPIKATNLSVGDVLALPMGRTATVQAIKPFGPRSTYLHFKTEFGWTRVFLDDEVFIEARVV